MTINDFPAETFEVLRDNMRTILDRSRSPIEQVVVQASENLHYDEVMKIVGICSGTEAAEDRGVCEVELVAMEDGRSLTSARTNRVMGRRH